MIPKLKLQTWKSGLNSTKVVILNNGTVNPTAKIQKSNQTAKIQSETVRYEELLFSWVDKTPGKNDLR